jgi:hypothetical protein
MYVAPNFTIYVIVQVNLHVFAKSLITQQLKTRANKSLHCLNAEVKQKSASLDALFLSITSLGAKSVDALNTPITKGIAALDIAVLYTYLEPFYALGGATVGEAIRGYIATALFL